MKKIKFKKISIYEITLSSFLLILIIISKQNFMSINFGFMRMGISYIFFIIAGLSLNLFLALLTAIMGDTFGVIFNGSIGLWHYSYFLIPIFIIAITFVLKRLFNLKKDVYIIPINFFIIFSMFATILVFLIYKNNLINNSKNIATNIDFTNHYFKIITWIMFGVFSLYIIILNIIFLIKRTEYLRLYININSIVSVIIILVIWLYGPIANILWLSSFHSKNYWGTYSVFAIPRILKTPLVLPIYNFIVISIYKTYETIKKTNVNSW